MKYSELCCTTVGAQGAFYLPKYGNEISNLSSQIIENPNFTNAKLLKKIAENDQNYLVRFKAERKLKELLYNKYQRQY